MPAPLEPLTLVSQHAQLRQHAQLQDTLTAMAIDQQGQVVLSILAQHNGTFA